MGALLTAIEDGREPLNGARGNLDALALVFAAIASARARRAGGAGDGAQPCRSARLNPRARRSGTPSPRTYEELRAVLASGTVHFPKRLRQVAIFLWQHPSEVAVGTISQVAEQAGVQPSTLVRFAQSLRLRRLLRPPGPLQGARQGLLARRPTAAGAGRQRRPALPERPRRRLARPRSPASATAFDAASFERAADLLAEAELIYVIGSKRAFPVTAYVSLALSQQGVKNVLVDNVGSTALDQVGCVGAARRGAGGELQPLQLDHPGPRRHGARPRRPRRRDHRQHLQPAGEARRRLDRGGRIRVRRLPLARRVARGRHGAGAGRRGPARAQRLD